MATHEFWYVADAAIAATLLRVTYRMGAYIDSSETTLNPPAAVPYSTNYINPPDVDADARFSR